MNIEIGKLIGPNAVAIFTLPVGFRARIELSNGWKFYAPLEPGAQFQFDAYSMTDKPIPSDFYPIRLIAVDQVQSLLDLTMLKRIGPTCEAAWADIRKNFPDAEFEKSYSMFREVVAKEFSSFIKINGAKYGAMMQSATDFVFDAMRFVIWKKEQASAATIAGRTKYVR